MLVLTASHGSAITIDTPEGKIQLYFREDPKCRTRVKVGIDAPRHLKIRRIPGGWDPDAYDRERANAR